MAKRFTDTAKWDHSWFRKLTPKMKCAWFYLLDKCDSAGIWNVDFEAMSFHVGDEITIKDLDLFSEKLKWLSSDKLLFLGFIEFQYGTLSEDCKPHKPVIERLRKLNLLEGYQKGFKTLEDKDKDKEQDKEKDKDQEKEKEAEVSKNDLLSLYAMYPRKEGKSKGLAKAKALLKTKALLADASLAIKVYIEHIKTNAIEPQFIKHFDTFMGSYRDWLDHDAGISIIKPQEYVGADLSHIFKKEGA